MNVSASKDASANGSASAEASTSSTRPPSRPSGLGEHLRALVDARPRCSPRSSSSLRDRAGAGGDVEHVRAAVADARDEEAAPARVLAEREQRRPSGRRSAPAARRARAPAAVRRGHGALSWPRGARGGARARRRARRGARGGRASASPPCCPPSRQPGARVYLVRVPRRARRAHLARARRRTASRSRTGRPSATPSRSRRSARWRPRPPRGGDLDELRSQLVALRLTEAPAGIEEAEEAALELQRTIGAPPQLATPARLDEIGAADAAARAGARPDRRLAVRRRDAGGVGRGRGARAARSRRPTALELQMSRELACRAWKAAASGFPFGGDPEELMRGLREFAEQQAETVQEAQREQFATLTLNTAVELTGGGARAGRRRAARPTSRRSRCATRCACSSPRRSRSSAPPARASCARRPELAAASRAEARVDAPGRSQAVCARRIARCEALRPRDRAAAARRAAAGRAAALLPLHRRADARGRAAHRGRAERGRASSRRSTSSARRSTRPRGGGGDRAAPTTTCSTAIDDGRARRERPREAHRARAQARPRPLPRATSSAVVRDAAARGNVRARSTWRTRARTDDTLRAVPRAARGGATTTSASCSRRGCGAPSRDMRALSPSCDRTCGSARASTSSRRRSPSRTTRPCAPASSRRSTRCSTRAATSASPRTTSG